jgi:hypothetical protein
MIVVAVAAIVCMSAVGCCCRKGKGIVLRGDWSLEFNRVPHMKSNGPQYQADCDDCVSCEATCEETCGCADGCVAGDCVGGSACRTRGGEGYASSSYGGPGFAGGAQYMAERGMHGGMHGGLGGEEGGHMPPPPNPTPAANTRFHPVPTRPVFERPMAAAAPEPAGEWVPSARGKSQINQ